jgi:hypothetical protein
MIPPHGSDFDLGIALTNPYKNSSIRIDLDRAADPDISTIRQVNLCAECFNPPISNQSETSYETAGSRKPIIRI